MNAGRASSPAEDVRRLLAETAADQRTAITATLIRTTGDWDLAQDCVQDAVERALTRWPVDGVPDNPAAWLTTAARNRALDLLRRRRTERAKLAEVAVMTELDRAADRAEQSVDDDRLRLLFTCCHPALPLESRVALTLRMAGGLSTRAIAQAFLISESTASQRLLRAKRKIGNAGIAFRVPAEHRLAERTGGVLAVLYLIFNEGYREPDGALGTEALRLARLLVELMPDEDEARGLLALMLFQHARRATRFDAAGDLVSMEEQDRDRWDRAAIDEGRWQLRRAASTGRPAGPYRLQAAIAGGHATAATADTTDWAMIVTHYDALHTAQPSPVIAFNRAIAVGMRDGPEHGLAELDRVAAAPELDGYHLLPAARADFLRRLGRAAEAVPAYRAALRLAPTEQDRRFLRRRLDELDVGVRGFGGGIMSRLEDAMQAQVDAGLVPGLVALAADGDEVEVVAVGGHDLAGTAPMTRDTVFRVASITKPIVAALTMMLVEDGRLALDAEVRRWLPELAEPTVLRHWSGPLDDVLPVERPITVTDLLTFRGGHGFPGDLSVSVAEVLLNRLHQGPPNPQRRQPPDEWLAELGRLPLLHQPGRGWTYNTGSDILGVLLARAAGQPLAELLAERIFAPLGMRDTGFVVPAASIPRLASYYAAEAGELTLLDGPAGQWAEPPPFPSGAGGLVSTVDDWFRFARLLLDDGEAGGRRLLTAESIEMMTTDHIGDRDRGPGGEAFLDGQGWGFGGGVDTRVTEPWQRPGRYGWVGGTGTSAYLHRPTRSVRIYLSQVQLGGPTSIDAMTAFWRATAAS